jgi:hypothetical protein
LYYARAKGGVDGIEHDESKEDNIDEQGLELQGGGRDSNNAIYKMAGGNKAGREICQPGFVTSFGLLSIAR